LWHPTSPLAGEDSSSGEAKPIGWMNLVRGEVTPYESGLTQDRLTPPAV
jgi:hypothetical protein